LNVHFSLGSCVGLSFDDVGSDTTVGEEFGLFVDGVPVGFILPIISDVGASVTTLSVGDDCVGLPLDDIGLDATIGDEFGLLVDAVGFEPSLSGMFEVGGPVINWSVGK